MRILLVNDDGFFAPGIQALRHRLAENHELFIVAPDAEKSGSSQTITFLQPLIARRVIERSTHVGYVVEGSPADCVKLAMFQLCPWRPDLVISGINHGLNAGINVMYSGTVGAAMEAAWYGLPSIAFSLEYDQCDRIEEAAVRFEAMIPELFEYSHGHRVVMNVNMPGRSLDEPNGHYFVPVDGSRSSTHFETGVDPKQREYFWASNSPVLSDPDVNTDIKVLSQGAVSVSPLAMNPTDHRVLEHIETRRTVGQPEC